MHKLEEKHRRHGTYLPCSKKAEKAPIPVAAAMNQTSNATGRVRPAVPMTMYAKEKVSSVVSVHTDALSRFLHGDPAAAPL
jgi:hypothetical protein